MLAYSVVKEQFYQEMNFLSKFGGAERDRTADPLLAKQALSQLSYSPIFGSLPLKDTGSIAEPFRLSDGGPR